MKIFNKIKIADTSEQALEILKQRVVENDWAASVVECEDGTFKMIIFLEGRYKPLSKEAEEQDKCLR